MPGRSAERAGRFNRSTLLVARLGGQPRGWANRPCCWPKGSVAFFPVETQERCYESCIRSAGAEMSQQSHRSDPRILNRRTLQRDHSYLARVLRMGMDVLDVGCGTGAITADI